MEGIIIWDKKKKKELKKMEEKKLNDFRNQSIHLKD
jgi:hypothetical protein